MPRLQWEPPRELSRRTRPSPKATDSDRPQLTGVMNDIPKRGSWEGDATPEPMKRPGMQRTVSKQVIQKAQFDVKQKLSDAMDTARAAELALRELLSSWRAAKYVKSISPVLRWRALFARLKLT